MKLTEQISLGGYAFTIEEDALKTLEEYIDKVRKVSSEDVREELTADIEERLAELFLEKCPKGTVVDLKVVRDSVDRIGVPSEDMDEEPSVKEKSSPKEKRFYRSLDDRVFGGVCSGAAKYFGVDVFLVRLIPSLIVILLFMASHHGHGAIELIIAYLLVWVIAPAPKTVEQKCHAEGKPLHFNEFKEQAESSKASIETTAEEVRTAPGFKAFGRFVAVTVGTIFALLGIAILVTDLFGIITFGSWATNFCQMISDSADRMVTISLVFDPLIQWSFVGMISLFGISMLYSGIVMILDLNSPKWRPGLIFFLVFMTCALFFGLSVFKHMIEISNLWM